MTIHRVLDLGRTLLAVFVSDAWVVGKPGHVLRRPPFALVEKLEPSDRRISLECLDEIVARHRIAEAFMVQAFRRGEGLEDGLRVRKW